MALTQINDRGLETPIDLLDNEKIRLGTGNDLELFHDGSASHIKDTGTGHLNLWSNEVRMVDAGGSEYMFRAFENGAVELYHNNAKKLETAAGGVITQGYVSIQGGSNGQLYVEDNGKVNLGTSQDLELYHDGTNSIIHNKTGQTWIQGSELYLSSNHADGQEKYLKGTANGSVELYHNNSKKFETTSDGIEVTGAIFASGKLDVPDDAKLMLGTGDDLQVYHSGSHSYLKNTTDYPLWIQNIDGQDVNISDINGENLAAKFHIGGAAELYYDNAKKFETTSAGAHCHGNLDFFDNHKVRLGTGSDLQIYHDGTDSYLQNTTGALYISPKSGENGIQLVPDGTVRLYHDNSAKFETTANGANVNGNNSISMDANANGQLQVVGSGYTGAIALNSNAMHIYHNSDARDLVFGLNETEKVRVRAGGGMTFNGDTAAANALDDYEEGTWTPTVNQGIDGGAQYISQYGWYTKVGRFVHASFYFQLVDATTGSQGNGNAAVIGGLPFAAGNITSYTSGGLLQYNSMSMSGSSQVFCYIQYNASTIWLYRDRNNSATWTTGANDNKGKTMYGTVSYAT